MPKYKKRADGRYCTNITVGFDQSTGKRKYKTIYGRTIQELEVKLADFRALQSKGVVISDEHMTLGDWADKWLVTYKSGLEYNTYRMYDNCVRRHIMQSVISNIPLSRIKTTDLQILINTLSHAGHIRSAEILTLCIKQIFNCAFDNELIYKNPAKTLVKPKSHAKQKRALNNTEKQAMETAALTPVERAILFLGRYAGLRRGEILALKKNDINLQTRKIEINKTIVFKNNKPELKLFPKSEAGNRSVPMPSEMYDFFKDFLPRINTIYLFAREDGSYYTETTFKRTWERIIKKLNIAAGGTSNLCVIQGLTPHILRHEYATSLYNAGIDIKTAQKLLGHSDIKMTLNIYTHLDQNDDQIIQKLDKLLSTKAD